jgi:hypothetical protein
MDNFKHTKTIGKYFMYADDVALIYKWQMNTDLISIANWMDKNLLTLNTNKTKIMLIETRKGLPLTVL